MSFTIAKATWDALGALLTGANATSGLKTKLVWHGQPQRGAMPPLEDVVTQSGTFGLSITGGPRDAGVATGGPTRLYEADMEARINHFAPDGCDAAWELEATAVQVAAMRALMPTSGAPAALSDLHAGYEPCRLEEVLGKDGLRVGLQSVIPFRIEFWA